MYSFIIVFIVVSITPYTDLLVMMLYQDIIVIFIQNSFQYKKTMMHIV